MLPTGSRLLGSETGTRRFTAGGFTSCAGQGQRPRNTTINGRTYALVADRKADDGWTIDHVEPGPPNDAAHRPSAESWTSKGRGPSPLRRAADTCGPTGSSRRVWTRPAGATRTARSMHATRPGWPAGRCSTTAGATAPGKRQRGPAVGHDARRNGDGRTAGMTTAGVRRRMAGHGRLATAAFARYAASVHGEPRKLRSAYRVRPRSMTVLRRSGFVSTGVGHRCGYRRAPFRIRNGTASGLVMSPRRGMACPGTRLLVHDGSNQPPSSRPLRR